MKIFKWTGILAILALVGWGCSSLHSPTITVSSWGGPEENAILSNLVDNYNKAHPNDIKVVLERVPWDQYTTKLMTQVAGGIAPDVIFVGTNDLATLYANHVLEPLDSYIKADNYSVSDVYSAVLNRFTVNGHLYVMPRDVAPECVVYYNKQAFDEAKLPYPTDDWTWSDLLADAKALTKTDATGRTTQWGYTELWPMAEAWIYSNGASWVNNVKNPTQYTFDTPSFIQALQYRANLINEYKVMPGPSDLSAMGGLGSSDLFMNGTAAMLLSGIWNTPQFREIKKFDWDVVMFPKGPTGIRGFEGGGSGYGILTSSQHKQQAWEFIKYIAGAQGESQMASTGLAQPALKSVADSGAFLDNQKPLNKKMLLRAVPYGIFVPFATNWSEIRDSIIEPIFDQLWAGKITAKEAVAQMAEALKNTPMALPDSNKAQ